MARKHKPEEIIGKLREAEIELARGRHAGGPGGHAAVTPSGA